MAKGVRMETNYIRLDGIIGEDNLKRLDMEFSRCVDIALKEAKVKTDGTGHPERGQKHYDQAIDRMIQTRRYMLAQLIEMWGSWKEKGDCHPKGIQLGKGGNSFASVIIEKR